MPLLIRRSILAIAVASFGAVVLVGGNALAAPPAKKEMTATEKSERAKTCSLEADKKGLHGKERKKFRSKCKRDGVT